MQSKEILTVKKCALEVMSALDEAMSIQQQSLGTESEVSLFDLYKMAPAIAAIYWGIEDEATKRKMIDVTWSAVHDVHEQIPGYIKKHRRCFVHAYLDSLIFLKLITLKKAEDVIDYIESKGKIENPGV